MKAIVGFSACAMFLAGSAFAEQKIVAAKLSKAEIEKALVGHTYPLGGAELGKAMGALYFQDKKTVVALWKGAKETATWRIGPDSSFCYTLKTFGGEECLTFLRDKAKGGYVQIFEGKPRVLAPGAIVKGNQLGAVGGM